MRIGSFTRRCDDPERLSLPNRYLNIYRMSSHHAFRDTSNKPRFLPRQIFHIALDNCYYYVANAPLSSYSWPPRLPTRRLPPSPSPGVNNVFGSPDRAGRLRTFIARRAAHPVSAKSPGKQSAALTSLITHGVRSFYARITRARARYIELLVRIYVNASAHLIPVGERR